MHSYYCIIIQVTIRAVPTCGINKITLWNGGTGGTEEITTFCHLLEVMANAVLI